MTTAVNKTSWKKLGYLFCPFPPLPPSPLPTQIFSAYQMFFPFLPDIILDWFSFSPAHFVSWVALRSFPYSFLNPHSLQFTGSVGGSHFRFFSVWMLWQIRMSCLSHHITHLILFISWHFIKCFNILKEALA